MPFPATYTNIMPVEVPEMVAVAPDVMVNTVLPKWTLQGVTAEQFGPIVRILLEVLVA
jgi:hypothetical protein